MTHTNVRAFLAYCGCFGVHQRRQGDSKPPWHFYGVEDYQTWLPRCGFTPVRIELVPKDMRHNGLDQLKGWMRTTWFPYTDRLPIDRRDTFADEAVGKYLRVHPMDEQGRTHMKMVRLEVEAVVT